MLVGFGPRLCRRCFQYIDKSTPTNGCTPDGSLNQMTIGQRRRSTACQWEAGSRTLFCSFVLGGPLLLSYCTSLSPAKPTPVIRTLSNFLHCSCSIADYRLLTLRSGSIVGSAAAICRPFLIGTVRKKLR